jgi:hypothetical protein
VATYTVNDRAVANARKLIDARQYVLDSDWGEAQPRAAEWRHKEIELAAHDLPYIDEKAPRPRGSGRSQT